MNARRAVVGLGANLGEPRLALAAAERAIDALPSTRIVLRSDRYRTAALGAPGPDYLNAVIAIDTGLDAAALLRALLGIETAAGRERPAPNAPRVLDLDLLLYGPLGGAFAAGHWPGPPALTLPHPRMHERRFVLEPLAAILPDCCIPGHGPVAALLATLSRQSVQRCERLPHLD
ncbi:MAG: 2-amino-4-hydroxy-6-hydroxymethyldihydropteridine diphosphokinase [Lautropia sp.]